MPALAERTKIKKEIGNTLSTTGLIYNTGYLRQNVYLGDVEIDVNTYMIASGSIRVQTQGSNPELSIKAKEFLYKLYNYNRLEMNWDGNEAIPPSENTIQTAANFLSVMDEFDLPIYFTAPGPNGEIVLEYKNNENTAEVFFENDNLQEMLLYNKKEQTYAGTVDTSLLINHLTK